MEVSWCEKVEERETRTTTDEGMDPEASEKWPRMVSRSMPRSRIRVTASPSQDGSTINDEVMSANESPPNGLHNDKDEEGLVHWCTRSVTALALLRFARDTDLSIFPERQAASEGQRWPTLEPIGHVLIR